VIVPEGLTKHLTAAERFLLSRRSISPYRERHHSLCTSAVLCDFALKEAQNQISRRDAEDP